MNLLPRQVLLTGIAAACIALLTQCSAPASLTRAHNNNTENVVFFDDFSTPVLDSTKWNIEKTGMHFNNELQAYVDSAATLFVVNGSAAQGAKNGALVLQPQYSPGFITEDKQKFNFISSRINTKNKVEFTYGTAAARIKLTEGAGLWPAWWMLGNGNWPETGEIDIMEYIGEKDWASAAVHGKGYSGDAGLADKLYFDENNDVTNWHIYAVEWSPDSLVFKFDGITVLRVTKPMASFFGEWAFDTPKFLILNFAVGGVYPYKINGINKPYYGLSQSTLQAIQNKESKMLVDWVKITKR